LGTVGGVGWKMYHWNDQALIAGANAQYENAKKAAAGAAAYGK